MRTLILALVFRSDSHVHVRVEMKNTLFFFFIVQMTPTLKTEQIIDNGK